MVAKRVKECRKQKEWTQQKLAEKTGLSFNTITKIEQGIYEYYNAYLFPGLNFSSFNGE